MIAKVVKMSKAFLGEYWAIFLCLKYQQAVKILYFKLRLMYLKKPQKWHSGIFPQWHFVFEILFDKVLNEPTKL